METEWSLRFLVDLVLFMFSAPALIGNPDSLTFNSGSRHGVMVIKLSLSPGLQV